MTKVIEVRRQNLLQQPRTLKSLAMVKLAKWITLQAEKIMSPELHANRLTRVARFFNWRSNRKTEAFLSSQIEIIRNILKYNVSRQLHDQLAIELIRALTTLEKNTKKDMWSMDQTKIWRMIETLFTEKLTFLLMNMDMLRVSLYSKSAMLTGLTGLYLYNPTKKSCSIIDETNIIQMLKKIPSLKYLALENSCTDNILRCLVENCKLIEDLNLNDSTLSDKHIDILIQLPNLRNVDLYATRVSEKEIEKLLKTCDNIEYIGVQPDIVACAIENIISSEKNPGRRFKLKHFLCEEEGEYISLKQLQLIVQKCPQIEQMRLVKDPIQTPESYLMALIDLDELTHLELKDYDFYADQVGNVLKVRGCSLVHLHLTGVEQIDLNALKFINQTCPNLECLIMNECNFVKHKVVILGLAIPEIILQNIPLFKKLKHIGLNAKVRETRPTDEQLFFLLSNSLNIEIISLGQSISFTDDIMSTVLNTNPLVNLRKISMVNNVFTKPVLDRIIRNCIRLSNVTNYEYVTVMAEDGP